MGRSNKRIAHIECGIDSPADAQARAIAYAKSREAEGVGARIHSRVVRAEGLTTKVYVVVEGA
jgi:hypothetical protein